MKQISSLFEKYKKTLKPPQASVEKEVVAVIAEVTGFSVTLEQVSYRPQTRTVQLQVPSILKTEIMKQRPDILRTLRGRLGVGNEPTTLL